MEQEQKDTVWVNLSATSDMADTLTIANIGSTAIRSLIRDSLDAYIDTAACGNN